MEGGVPPGWDDLFSEECWAAMSEEGKQAILSIISKEQESRRRRLSSVGGGSPNLINSPAESHGDGAGKRKSDDGCDFVANEKANTKINPTPGVSIADDRNLLSSRDIRQSDTLVWLSDHDMHLSKKKALEPMRHPHCELKERCPHYPSPMLQILDVFVKCYWKHDGIAGPYYDVMPDNTFCPDLKMDVYGMVAIRDPLDDYSRNYIFNRSRENAQTMNADGGYLCLRNAASEHRRDCDGFVASVGKHAQNFVAAVNIGDTLCIDFMEKDRDCISFLGSKHGNEQQLYRFCSGAVVSVQVYWSTIVETVELVEKSVTQ
ncbi:hypothetical protein ACQ4PT_059636 [Festuca glaucescens]